jgi:hypothetical protein
VPSYQPKFRLFKAKWGNQIIPDVIRDRIVQLALDEPDLSLRQAISHLVTEYLRYIIHDESHLRRYLGWRLIVLLGDADTDAAAPDLARSETAMAQGPHRLARGLWHFEHGKQVADQLGGRFGWELEIVPGAGHVDQQIFDRAASILGD